MSALSNGDLQANAVAMTLDEAHFALDWRKANGTIEPPFNGCVECLLELADDYDDETEGYSDALVTAANLILLGGDDGAELWEAVEAYAQPASAHDAVCQAIAGPNLRGGCVCEGGQGA